LYDLNHPEEILAANFAFTILDADGLPSPWIVDGDQIETPMIRIG
jgi:hypothetical protein